MGQPKKLGSFVNRGLSGEIYFLPNIKVTEYSHILQAMEQLLFFQDRYLKNLFLM